MANYKEEVMTYISTAALPEEDFVLLKKVLENLPEELCEDVLNFFKLNPSHINYAVDNLKKKKTALDNKDKETWDKILADENNFLQTFIKA